MSRPDHRILAGLLILLAVSLGIRVWQALPGLEEGRFIDERYPLENIEVLLKKGQLRPANGLHPGLSYLPHALLLEASRMAHRVSGIETFAVFDSRGKFSPTAYFLCRMLQVVFATTSLWLTFLIGRRLGGDTLGLLAALFLSTTPWHIRQSVVYKADMTLVVTVVLAFYLSLRAIDRPTQRRYIAAGIAIGLSLAAKFNAAPIAVPLVVGTLLTLGLSSRSCLSLLSAATASAATFVAFDPYAVIDPDFYLNDMGRTIRIYQRKAVAAGAQSRWGLVPNAARDLASGGYFGPVVGTLGLLGLLATASQALIGLHRSRTGVGWLMLASYPVSYLAFYAVGTSRPDPHNWLPMAPFVALGAAWMVRELGRRILTLVPEIPGRRILTAALCATLVGMVSWPALRFSYSKAVPTTADRALEFLQARLKRPNGRLVVSESELVVSPYNQRAKRRFAIADRDHRDLLGPVILTLSDAEIFPLERLSDPGTSSMYRQRVSIFPSEDVLVVEPRPFRAQGQALVCIAHPFHRGRKRLEGLWIRSPSDSTSYSIRLPEINSEQAVISVEFMLPPSARSATIEIDGVRVPPIPYHPGSRITMLTSPRFRPEDEVAMRLESKKLPEQIPLTAKLWRKGRH